MAAPERIVVIGAGGHGKVVVSLAQELGYEVAVILDDDEHKWGTRILSASVDGPVGKIEGLSVDGAILALGDNKVRLQLAERYRGIKWLSAVHPRSWAHSSVTVGEGSVVFAGAIVQPDTRIGAHCILNTASSVDHDCLIGDGVHLAPGCHLAGGGTIGTGSFLGVGVSVIPGIRIGKGVVVGAGAAVVSDLPDGVLALGVPAKPVRSLLQGKKEGC